MTKHQYKSIKDKGGLKVHLNTTKDIHRGFGYKTWRIARTAGLNVTARAKLFNVTFDTCKSWDKLDDEIAANKQAADEAAIEELSDV